MNGYKKISVAYVCLCQHAFIHVNTHNSYNSTWMAYSHDWHSQRGSQTRSDLQWCWIGTKNYCRVLVFEVHPTFCVYNITFNIRGLSQPANSRLISESSESIMKFYPAAEALKQAVLLGKWPPGVYLHKLEVRSEKSISTSCGTIGTQW